MQWWLNTVLSVSAWAQSGELEPQVVRPEGEVVVQVVDHRGRPVEGRLVVGDRSWSLNEAGEARLVLPVGRYVARIETDGDHLPQTRALTVLADESSRLAWRLEAIDAAIVVVGEAPRNEVARQIVTAEELRRVPGSFGDPLRALQSLPAVARSATVEGALVVRGTEALNTATYIDQVPVPYLYHFVVGRSVINPSLIEDIEFYPGGLPSRFGDSTQAAVNVRTRPPSRPRKVGGRITADLLDASIALTGPLKRRGSWQAAYRNSWLPQLVSAFAWVYAQGRGLGDQPFNYPTLGYQDWLLRTTHRSSRHDVALTGLGARDVLRERQINAPPEASSDDSELPYDPMRLLDTQFVRLHFRHRYTSPRYDQLTSIAVGPERESSLLGGLTQLSDGIEFGRRSAFTFDLRRLDDVRFGRHGLQLGVQALYQAVRVEDYDNLDDDNQALTTRDRRLSAAAFGELSFRVGRTTISPGIRAQFHRFRAETWVRPEPRLGLRLGLSETVTATGFVGRFSQIPPADRYAEGVGNPDVTLIEAWQASVGFEARFESGLQVDATLFGSLTDNQVVEELGLELRELGRFEEALNTDAVPVRRYRTAPGRAIGAEAFVRMPVGRRWWGWVALTVARSVREDRFGGRVPSDYDAPVSLTVVAARDLGRGYGVSARGQITSGYPFTPQAGVLRLEEDAWTYEGLPQGVNQDRLPLYRRLDVRIDKTWEKRRADITLALDVQNVLNHRNPLQVTYRPLYDGLVTESFLPILPNVGLEVAF